MGSRPPIPLHERIRNRREEMGLSAVELARRAEISPSYVSLIEKGVKIPSDSVAAAIAVALDDDPDLYVGWVHSSKHENLDEHVAMLDRVREQTSTPEKVEHLASGADLEADQVQNLLDMTLSEPTNAFAMRIEPSHMRRLVSAMASAGAKAEPEQATFDEPSFQRVVEDGGMVAIPVLEDGADPEEYRADPGRAVEMLRLDVRMLPDGPLERPFAYRPEDPTLLRQVRDRVRPGDLLILTRSVGRITTDRIYAVRHRGRVILSRALFKKNALMLLPPAGSEDVQVVEVAGRADLSRVIAGTVMLTVRSWGRGRQASRESKRSILRRAARKLFNNGRDEPSPARPVATPRWRSAQIEGKFLVRDCEWKEGYGWRPLQRAEDMDFLDAHPGMKVRFRLLREGEERYRLEMDPEQWREALGDYVDGRSWRRNGYITPVTRMRKGRYTEEFKERWKPFVRPVHSTR